MQTFAMVHVFLEGKRDDELLGSFYISHSNFTHSVKYTHVIPTTHWIIQNGNLARIVRIENTTSTSS